MTSKLAEMLQNFTETQMEKYEEIYDVNQKAAILWAVQEGKEAGMVR